MVKIEGTVFVFLKEAKGTLKNCSRLVSSRKEMCSEHSETPDTEL